MDAGSQAERASGDLENVLATREKALRTAQVSGLAQVFFAPAGHSCSGHSCSAAMHFMRPHGHRQFGNITCTSRQCMIGKTM